MPDARADAMLAFLLGWKPTPPSAALLGSSKPEFAREALIHKRLSRLKRQYPTTMSAVEATLGTRIYVALAAPSDGTLECDLRLLMRELPMEVTELRDRVGLDATDAAVREAPLRPWGSGLNPHMRLYRDSSGQNWVVFPQSAGLTSRARIGEGLALWLASALTSAPLIVPPGGPSMDDLINLGLAK